MPPEPAIADIAHVVQLAVAPVFLLTGIGAMLGVMTTRLSRVIDRARVVDGLVQADPLVGGEYQREMSLLCRRWRIIGWSIGLCTFAALLIAGVVAILFLGAFLGFDASVPVALLFIGAMLALILALLLFLREVHLASASLIFRRPKDALAGWGPGSGRTQDSGPQDLGGT
ncbi:MAG: DUF2721 domain-containing protein [Bdellovibrio bacteriovorus]